MVSAGLVNFKQDRTSSVLSVLIFLKAEVGPQWERERKRERLKGKEGEPVCFEGIPPLSRSPSYEG